MSIDTNILVWLFPIAFMFHDFEEIIFWELWLKKNREEITRRVPAFLANQISAITGKSTAEAAFSIWLIFSLTVLASFLAAQYGHYGFFLVASGSFFLHGFMHLGQAIALRKYVPAVITSALIVIPYGLVLYGRLLYEGVVGVPALLVYFVFAAALTIPLILIMHKAGEYLYKKAVGFLV